MRIHFKKHIKSVHFGMIFSSRPAVEKIWENDKLFIKGISESTFQKAEHVECFTLYSHQMNS